MIRRPPRSTRTDTLFPYTTLFRTVQASAQFAGEQELGCCRAFKPLPKIYRVIGAYVAPLSKAALLGNPRLLALPVMGRHEDEGPCRSEERRVGTERVITCRYRGSRTHKKKETKYRKKAEE